MDTVFWCYHSIHIIIEKVEFILMALRQSIALSCRQFLSLSFIFFALHINKTEQKGGFWWVWVCVSCFLWKSFVSCLSKLILTIKKWMANFSIQQSAWTTYKFEISLFTRVHRNKLHFLFSHIISFLAKLQLVRDPE